MAQNYGNKINTSLYGRRFGLQLLTTALNGGRKLHDYLVGPDALRAPVTTGETTATNLDPFGVSAMTGSSAASSSVYTIDPPVPGVMKVISISDTANGPIYLKTKNSETFVTTLGTSFTTIKTSAGGAFLLAGVTTAVWAAIGITSGTSSNGSGFVLTTST